MALTNFLDRFSNEKAVKQIRVDDKEVSSDGIEPVETYQALRDYNEEHPEPTVEEYAHLPRVLTHAPYVTYCICLIEFAERASYYGVRDRLSNFIQLSLPTDSTAGNVVVADSEENAGALGLGLQTASAVYLLLTFLAYLTPLYGGYISDKSLGRMKTIWWGVWIGFIAHIVLIIAAIPSVIASGKAALAPTVISIVLLAFGTGFIKPNLLPLLYDQYPHPRDFVKTNEDGTKVIVSKEQSLERMTLVFYWAINVGSFLSLGTSYCAKRIGFWLAFLVPGIAYLIMIPVLIILAPKLKKEIPTGVSVLAEAVKVLKVALKGNWIKRLTQSSFWEYPKPTNMINRGAITSIDDVNEKGKKKVSWSDQFVDDLRVTWDACKLFLFFIVYNINDGGIGSIQNSQSASMSTNGVPNDLISNFNPLTIIVVIPILDYGVYPLFRRWGFDFLPVYRIFFGFTLAALAAFAGAIIQWKVYETSPCGYYATDCDGVSPISVWVEVILYIMQASSECFANTAAYEIAYTRAPENMKGLVMALFLLMQSIAAAVSEALVSVLVDPHLIWPFVAMGFIGLFCAFLFLWMYKDLHKVMAKERLEKEEKMRQAFLEHYQATNGSDLDENKLEAVVSEKMEARNEVTSILAEKDAMDMLKR